MKGYVAQGHPLTKGRASFQVQVCLAPEPEASPLSVPQHRKVPRPASTRYTEQRLYSPQPPAPCPGLRWTLVALCGCFRVDWGQARCGRTHADTHTRTYTQSEREGQSCMGSSLLAGLTLRGQVYFAPVTALPQALRDPGQKSSHPPVQHMPHPLLPPLQARLLLTDFGEQVGSGSTPPSPLLGLDFGVEGIWSVGRGRQALLLCLHVPPGF